MRVMIAGAEYSTLSRLESYIANLGHAVTIARNGKECKAGLNEFVPDLLVMELDIFWSGYDGVMSTLIGDPQTNEIPVVFFTEFYKQLPQDVYPRIIARLKHPFQSQELSKLKELLDNMELARVVNALVPTRNGKWNANCESLVTGRTEVASSTILLS